MARKGALSQTARAGALGCLLGVSALPSAAVGAPDQPGAAATSLDALPPLPDRPSLALPQPSAEDVRLLQSVLASLQSPTDSEREEGARQLLEVKPRQVAAIAKLLNTISEHSDKDAMKRVCEGARRRVRSAVRSRSTDIKEAPEPAADLVASLLATPQPESPGWRDLVGVVGLTRMLAQIGTIEAARQVVEVYVRFGEFLRVDVQVQLERFAARGIAALTEAKRHPAPKVARWAERQLDVLGRAIPSEAVRTEDFEGLADILRAFGRIRDPDAARIVVSFANTERSQVRMAARQAIVMMGEVAGWQLRDTFEGVVGQRPPRDWSWERCARELFGRFDRQRLALVYDSFDAGLAALAKKDLAQAVLRFDDVLAHSPRFDRAAEMAGAYLSYAETLAGEKQSAAALAAARRAARLSPPGPQHDQAMSLVMTLEGEQSLARGISDQYALRRALELDPTNARARSSLTIARHPQQANTPYRLRYLAAGLIGAIAVAALGVIAFQRRSPRPPEPPPPDDDSQTDVEAEQTEQGSQPPCP
jgi:tetratricopeptide (TPR) repeat protein